MSIDNYGNDLVGVFFHFLKNHWNPKGYDFLDVEENYVPGDGNILSLYKRNIIDAERIQYLMSKKKRTAKEEKELVVTLAHLPGTST